MSMNFGVYPSQEPRSCSLLAGRSQDCRFLEHGAFLASDWASSYRAIVTKRAMIGPILSVFPVRTALVEKAGDGQRLSMKSSASFRCPDSQCHESTYTPRLGFHSLLIFQGPNNQPYKRREIPLVAQFTREVVGTLRIRRVDPR